MAAWMDGGLPSGSRSFAVPISKFQSDVLRSLAAQRSPDSYIAGGVAINRDGPRFSGDIVVPPASGMPGGGCGESYGQHI